MSYINNWIWSQKASGYLDTEYISIITLSSKHIIISGYFYESCTFGDIILTGDNKNIFLAKMDEDGNWLWATKITTSNNEEKYVIKALSDDSIIIAGTYNSSIVFGNITLSKYNTCDTYVAKISQDGECIWAINTNSTNYNYLWDLSISLDDSIYITGYFFSEMIIDQTTIVANDNNLTDMYVAKIDNSGNWLWINNAGGINYDYNNKIATLSDGSAIITGAVTDICNFGNSFTINDVSDNVSDKLCIYVAKIDNLGNWIWVITFYNNIINNYSLHLTITIEDSIYIAGYFTDTITIGNTTLTSYGINDIFISKINTSGDWLWTRQGGNVNTNGMCLKSAANNCIIILCNVNKNNVFGDINNPNSGLLVTSIYSDGRWNFVKLININSDVNNYYIDDMCINNKFGYITGYFSDIIENSNDILISDGAFDIYVIKLIVDYNIMPFLLVTHERIKNSYIEDKINLLKELYDIHNFHKYNFNYMVKKKINTDIDHIPDPTANLINLYHTDADIETMILQNFAKKYKQSMNKIELEVDPAEIEEKRLRILNNSINLYHLDNNNQSSTNKKYDQKKIEIPIQVSSLLNVYHTNININTEFNRYRYKYNQIPEIIEDEELVVKEDIIKSIPKTSLLSLDYNVQSKKVNILNDRNNAFNTSQNYFNSAYYKVKPIYQEIIDEDTIQEINPIWNSSTIKQNSLTSLHYKIKPKQEKIDDKIELIKTTQPRNNVVSIAHNSLTSLHYKIKPKEEKIDDEPKLIKNKQKNNNVVSITQNSLSSLHYKVKPIQEQIVNKPIPKDDYIESISKKSLTSLHYKVKQQTLIDKLIDKSIDTEIINNNIQNIQNISKVITEGSLINLHHKQTKNVPNKEIKEIKNNPANNLINLYYTSPQDNLLKKSNNKKK